MSADKWEVEFINILMTSKGYEDLSIKIINKYALTKKLQMFFGIIPEKNRDEILRTLEFLTKEAISWKENDILLNGNLIRNIHNFYIFSISEGYYISNTEIISKLRELIGTISKKKRIEEFPWAVIFGLKKSVCGEKDENIMNKYLFKLKIEEIINIHIKNYVENINTQKYYEQENRFLMLSSMLYIIIDYKEEFINYGTDTLERVTNYYVSDITNNKELEVNFGICIERDIEEIIKIIDNNKEQSNE